MSGVKREELIGDIPIFTVKRDGRALVFTCPSCGVVNRHGRVGEEFGAGDGHRGAHCSCWPRGYNLREVKPEYMV